MVFDIDAVGRLAAAVVLGAVIGLEREASDQPAGLRTHITVCLGAALFGVISTLGFSEFVVGDRSSTNVQVDVTRVASQVVVGIGFLGAGVIFRQGLSVKNLTTAASLWATAAIGLTSGVGDHGTAAVATVLLVACLIVLRVPRAWVHHTFTRDSRQVRITLTAGADPGGLIGDVHALDGVEVDKLSLQKERGTTVVVLALESKPSVSLDDCIGALVSRPDVDTLEVG